MKTLVLVRHGDYNADGTLTQAATARMLRAAEFISSRIESPISIACSVQARAMNSADLLTERLHQARIDYFEELATGKDAPVKKYARGDMEAVHTIVERMAEDSESVVLVIHYEVCNYYPDFYLERVFGTGFGCRPMKRGEALIIDSTTGDCELLEVEGFLLSWNGVTGDGFERIKY